jgi:mannose-1-phosphate guanylyltransferase
MNKYAIIMAGGVGTRFWPMSRIARPKQFLDMLGLGKSLLQMTYERFAKFVDADKIFIVTNEQYRELILQQLPEINDFQILGEPMAKNTAPCIAYACYKIHSKDPNAVCVVAPSDHLILNESEFIKKVEQGIEFASSGNAVLTLGIKPSRPDTGYGYIQYIENETAIKPVKTFTEKPNSELAEEFVKSGDFLWNAGIFIWRSSTIIDSFEQHLPEMAALFAEGKGAYYTKEESTFIERIYPVCSNISIDYGIIEKAENVHVIPSDFGWSDLGTWKSLHDVANKDQSNSVFIGKNIQSDDAQNNLVVSHGEKLIVVQGVSNMFILDTEDALLVCHMDDEQEVKAIVGRIRNDYKGKFN